MNRKKQSSSKNVMWIYGRHAVKAAVLNEKRSILRLILLESNKSFLSEVDNKHFKPEIVDRNLFSSIFGKDAAHQGCAALVECMKNASIEDILENENDDRPIVILDQITDPQNIGSILRASAVFGARALVIPENHSPELTPAISKVASGALELVPLIKVVNLVNAANTLKKHGFWIVGLDERSEKTLAEIDLNGKFAFVIGSEGDGMRRLTREMCDFLVHLRGVGTFATLNAAQAATVSLYESLRQRITKC